MKVYVASSWRNEYQPGVVKALRDDGYEVYDFRHPEPGDRGFAWSEIDPAEFIEVLKTNPIAKRGFDLDMAALEECDACVLVLPCGVSAHLELSWAIGAGKLGIVYAPEIREPELMQSMAAPNICITIPGVLNILKCERDKGGE